MKFRDPSGSVLAFISLSLFRSLRKKDRMVCEITGGLEIMSLQLCGVYLWLVHRAYLTPLIQPFLLSVSVCLRSAPP